MSERILKIQTAPVFEPLLSPSRYKGAWGGRGSGKSHFFASLMIEQALERPGFRAVCIREVQRTLAQSSKRLLEDKIRQFGLLEADGFKTYEDRIKTRGDGLITFQGMQDHTAESVKSLEGIDRAWIEEAQTLSERSLSLLRPTIRAEGSEIWASWNPRRKSDPIDRMFRGGALPTGSIVVKANWSDNPWFPAVLESERLDCQRQSPDQYDHIWEGDYATVQNGAYYAKQLLAMRSEGRVARLARDPLMTVRAIWDIGGTGAKADACAIWIAQFVAREIRILDYYEAVGQPLATHVGWLRSKGYGDALCILPHDGATQDRVHDASYEGALKQAGFSVRVVANQGRGAAMMRIEAARRLFPSIWAHEATTAAGFEALAAYHPKIDAARNIDLGPEHDWSSHAADAFGLMCVAYEAPETGAVRPVRVVRSPYAHSSSGWLAG